MAEKDAAGAATEFDNPERKGLANNCLLSVFLNEFAGECKSFSVTVKSDVGALVGK